MNGERRDKCPSAAWGHTGFGMLGVIASMAVIAVLAVIAVSTLGGNPTTTVRIPGAAPVRVGGAAPAIPGGVIALAGDTAAQQNLSSALSVVDEAATAVGGYGFVDASSLVAQDSRFVFTSGPSTSVSQISVAATGRTDGGVTLALRSVSGTCWFIWTSNTATWYGAQSGHSMCAAPMLPNAPVTSAAGNGVIGWHAGAFPPAPPY
jgi:hypothetical protein